MPGPVASIILPAFNAAATLARAAQSILDQSLRQLELLVVDDGSTDATVEIAQRMGRADSRLRLIRQTHQGVAAAANTGLQHARATRIARMDADDYAYPKRLERQLQWMLDHNLDVVGCQVRILNQRSQPVPGMQRYARWINEETPDHRAITALRFVEFPLVNPTLLAGREYFELGFRDHDFPEDYDLMLRAASAGLRFGKVPQVLLDWTDHAARLTRTDHRYSKQAFRDCRRAHLLRGPLCRTPQVDLWGLGQTGKPWLQWLQSQDIAVRYGYDLHPRKIHQRIHGVFIRHPRELPPADGTPILVAVGAADARSQILPQLESRGHVIGEDAWFVA